MITFRNSDTSLKGSCTTAAFAPTTKGRLFVVSEANGLLLMDCETLEATAVFHSSNNNQREGEEKK